MEDAVSSAEQWKEFAEKLGAEKETLQSTLASTKQMLAVVPFPRSSCAYWISIPHALEVPDEPNFQTHAGPVDKLAQQLVSILLILPLLDTPIRNASALRQLLSL